MNEFFFAALSFGLAAGLKPGPLSIIVIQQTLSKGLPAGVRASLTPLITDGPIIIAALWFLTQFKSIGLFAAALGLLGGLYLIWLAVRLLAGTLIWFGLMSMVKAAELSFHYAGDF